METIKIDFAESLWEVKTILELQSEMDSELMKMVEETYYRFRWVPVEGDPEGKVIYERNTTSPYLFEHLGS